MVEVAFMLWWQYYIVGQKVFQYCRNVSKFETLCISICIGIGSVSL